MAARLEQLVIESARQRPETIAIEDSAYAWTYRQLDDWSDRLAAHFASLGVTRRDRVAVWSPKSCRAVAVFQAVLRLGAAYVPIDPATPAARAARIIEDCDMRLIVTTRTMGASLTADRRQFPIDDDAVWNACVERGDGRYPVGGGEHDLAYILYTSGSTGTPKGVCISHRNALAFVEWAVRAARVAAGAVFSNHASFNFDLSVFDLYGAFSTGSTVCLIPETITYVPARLIELMSTHRISVWYSVPSALMLMMDHGLLDAHDIEPDVVIFAGEPFPVRHLRALRAHWTRAGFFNFYGPTETNVCTSYEVRDIPPDQVAPVPIGTAASGDRVWAITDARAEARPGERGELFVDGPTVMLGYWGAPPHTGPYATGDLCLARDDGGYEFIGRRDHMVKLRGHRVELGEIEAALSQHANVREVAVATIGEGLDRQLVAFVAPLGVAPTLLQLKALGAKSLPRYMLIDRVQEVEALPRTPNGKVDRRALVHALSATRTSVQQNPGTVRRAADAETAADRDPQARDRGAGRHAVKQ